MTRQTRDRNQGSGMRPGIPGVPEEVRPVRISQNLCLLAGCETTGLFVFSLVPPVPCRSANGAASLLQRCPSQPAFPARYSTPRHTTTGGRAALCAQFPVLSSHSPPTITIAHWRVVVHGSWVWVDEWVMSVGEWIVCCLSVGLSWLAGLVSHPSTVACGPWPCG